MNQDAHDLVALGAAGALSDDEYRTLEGLLAADPALAAEHRELQMSAAVLAEASSEPPPPALRAAVLDAIRNVEQVPAVVESTPATARTAAEPPPSAQGVRHAPATVVPIHRRRWMVPATAAAAVVMLLVAGLLVNQFADAPSDDRVAAVLDDPDATTIELTGALTGLRLISSDDQGASVLMGADVVPPDEGTVFQLWAILGDDAPVGMATFRPAATGEIALLIDSTDADAEYAVTVEPEGGSEQPTSDLVAVSPGLA